MPSGFCELCTCCRKLTDSRLARTSSSCTCSAPTRAGLDCPLLDSVAAAAARAAACERDWLASRSSAPNSVVSRRSPLSRRHWGERDKYSFHSKIRPSTRYIPSILYHHPYPSRHDRPSISHFRLSIARLSSKPHFIPKTSSNYPRLVASNCENQSLCPHYHTPHQTCPKSSCSFILRSFIFLSQRADSSLSIVHVYWVCITTPPHSISPP